MSSGGRQAGAFARLCLVILAVSSALLVSGPAFYLRIMKGFQRNPSSSSSPPPPFSSSSSSSACPNCICDCPATISLQKIAPGLVNLTIPDCGKEDSEVGAEMEKGRADLMKEEAALRMAVVEDERRHMNYTIGEARRQGLQYQKEAQKCNSATEACEEAREHAEAMLKREKKVTAAWERRARQLGWTDPA
ncbi:uncharacterized protein LOC144708693 isoform X2 [Wolffia australiana]